MRPTDLFLDSHPKRPFAKTHHGSDRLLLDFADAATSTATLEEAGPGRRLHGSSFVEVFLKPALLSLLICPACAASFELSSETSEGTEIMEGTLRCVACNITFPITRG